MRYEMMFPSQIRQAIKENWPVILPVGVLEYHGEHCVVGVDTILVVKAVEILEKEMNIVVLPPFYYGSASYAVEGPENNGTVHTDSDVVHLFARELFRNLLRIGFKNIHIFIHHQSENFASGMPTDLAFKLAARQSTFEFLEKNNGEGWWRNEKMQNYFKQYKAGIDPFSWIKIHPFMAEEIQKIYQIDHADFQETSLMMAFCPDGVNKKNISNKKWYCKNAKKANLEYGTLAKKMIIKKMQEILKNS